MFFGREGAGAQWVRKVKVCKTEAWAAPKMSQSSLNCELKRFSRCVLRTWSIKVWGRSLGYTLRLGSCEVYVNLPDSRGLGTNPDTPQKSAVITP
jgi:hypothetical protein